MNPAALEDRARTDPPDEKPYRSTVEDVITVLASPVFLQTPDGDSAWFWADELMANDGIPEMDTEDARVFCYALLSDNSSLTVNWERRIRQTIKEILECS